MKFGFRIFILALALLALTAGLAVAPHAARALGAGEVAGVVYFDNNGNDQRDGDEPGLVGVVVEIRDQATNGQTYFASTNTAADGAYHFYALDARAYVVKQIDQAGFLSTTDNERTVTVASGPVTGIDFGDAHPITLSGVVFDDLNGNGVRGLTEPVVPNAYVEAIEDLNHNSQYDSGEPVRGVDSATDEQGAYIIENLAPGDYVVRVRKTISSPPTTIPLDITGCLDCGTIASLDVPLPPGSGNGSLTGLIWHDADGDEDVDATGEPPLAGVAVRLYLDNNANGQVDAGDTQVGQDVSDTLGAYGFSNLASGQYVLQVDDLTAPAGWVLSLDPAALALTVAGGPVTLNLGYYDPLTVAPMNVGEWKKEVKQIGHPHYTPAEVAQFITLGQNSSALFPEVVTLEDALLHPAPGSEGKARKQYAAFLLNMMSGRLMPKTPVNLPNLTTATTVAAVRTELEGILYPPAAQLDSTYRRAEDIADALNKGQGLGYGLTGVSAVSRATYKGSNVTSYLKSGGPVVDVFTDSPLYLTKWSPGSLDPTINIFRPQIRFKVQVFYNGAVLDVVQKLSDGRLVTLKTIVPPIWNKDVKTTYTADLWRVATLADLASTELQLVVRDPDGDSGPPEHVKIDSAELVFQY